MSSSSSNSDSYINKHLNASTPAIQKENFKELMHCAAVLDNIHDFKDTKIKQKLESKGLMKNVSNCSYTKFNSIAHSISQEDKYLELLGLERNSMNHWTYNKEKDRTRNEIQLMTKQIFDEYRFINFNPRKENNPVIDALTLLLGKPPISHYKVDSSQYRNNPHRPIDLIIDTQIGLGEALEGYQHYFNFLDCAATRIDPAGKSYPGTPAGKKYPLFTNAGAPHAIYYKTIQEVLEIPSYKNAEYPNKHGYNGVLFSSNANITLYTGSEKKKAYLLFRPDKQTYPNAGKTHGDNEYLVPASFLQKSSLIPQTLSLLKSLFKTLINEFKNRTVFKKGLKKRLQVARKNSDLHFICKRFGDAIQALYCRYIYENNDSNNIPWLVTYDRPLLGHALLYKTPVIVFAGHRDKYIPGSGIMIAIHNDILNNTTTTTTTTQQPTLSELKELILEDIKIMKKILFASEGACIQFIPEEVQTVDDNKKSGLITEQRKQYRKFIQILYKLFHKDKNYENMLIYSKLEYYYLILSSLDVDDEEAEEEVELITKLHIQITKKVPKEQSKIEDAKNKIGKIGGSKMKRYLRKEGAAYIGGISPLFYLKNLYPRDWDGVSKLKKSSIRKNHIGGRSFLLKTKKKMEETFNFLSKDARTIESISPEIAQIYSSIKTYINIHDYTRKEIYILPGGGGLVEDAVYKNDKNTFVYDNLNKFFTFHKFTHLLIYIIIEELVAMGNISHFLTGPNLTSLAFINPKNYSGNITYKYDTFLDFIEESMGEFDDDFDIDKLKNYYEKMGLSDEYKEQYNEENNLDFFDDILDEDSENSSLFEIYNLLNDYYSILVTNNNFYEEYVNAFGKKPNTIDDLIEMDIYNNHMIFNNDDISILLLQYNEVKNKAIESINELKEIKDDFLKAKINIASGKTQEQQVRELCFSKKNFRKVLSIGNLPFSKDQLRKLRQLRKARHAIDQKAYSMGARKVRTGRNKFLRGGNKTRRKKLKIHKMKTRKNKSRK